MTKSTFMIGLMLGLLSPVTNIQADDLRFSGKIPSGTTETHDPAKEDACDCCQKCKAAESPIKSAEKEGVVIKDPCRDCCQRCGKVLHPAPLDIPPDIVNKPMSPEIMDKHGR